MDLFAFEMLAKYNPIQRACQDRVIYRVIFQYFAGIKAEFGLRLQVHFG